MNKGVDDDGMENDAARDQGDIPYAVSYTLSLNSEISMERFETKIIREAYTAHTHGAS